LTDTRDKHTRALGDIRSRGSVLRYLKEEQVALSKKKLELYANCLQIDIHVGLKSHAVAQDTIDELEAQLEVCNKEYETPMPQLEPRFYETRLAEEPEPLWLLDLVAVRQHLYQRWSRATDF
jgi:hypothetical protein